MTELRLFAASVGSFAVISDDSLTDTHPEEKNGMPSRISPLALAILLLLVVTGCAKKTEETADTEGSTVSTDRETEGQSQLTDEQKRIQGMFLQAQKDFQAGQLDDAVAQMEKALKTAPDDIDVQMSVAVVFAKISMSLGKDEVEMANKLVSRAEELVQKQKPEDDLNKQRTEQLLVQITFEKARQAAMVGKNDKAVGHLNDLREQGFPDFSVVEGIEDFEAFRQTPQFDKFARSVGLRGFDFDFSLPSAMDDSTVSLKQFDGKVVVVDIWGTWCGPCKMEIPHFVKLQEEYGDQGLQIVGINYEDLDNSVPLSMEKDRVQQFADDYQINYPLAIGDDETREQVPDFAGFPTTLFIDREGVVQKRLGGAYPYETLESIVKSMLGDEKADTAAKPESSEPKSSEAPAKTDGPAVAEPGKS